MINKKIYNTNIYIMEITLSHITIICIVILLVILLVSNSEYFGQTNDSKDINDIVRYNKQEIDDKINLYFNEVQFHTNYRDVNDAFNNIAPAQRVIFNLEYSPVDMQVVPATEVKSLVDSFIKQLNNSIKNDVYENTNQNSGWDETMPNPTVKSGWDKHMESLGLHPNLYGESAKKSQVKLVAVDRVEKSVTANQTKYSCFMYIQKKGVVEQMVVRVSFVMDNSDINIDRDGFVLSLTKKINPTNVVIEEIFVLGFMTELMTPNQQTKSVDNFYNFDGLNKNQTDIIDQSTIMKELIKKYKSKASEMKNFTTSLDTNGELDFSGFSSRVGSAHPQNYKSYQSTQTIFDDFTQPINFKN